MRIFMLEWYDEQTHNFRQEYYLHIQAASTRYNDIESRYREANPDISTLWVNEDEEIV